MCLGKFASGGGRPSPSSLNRHHEGGVGGAPLPLTGEPPPAAGRGEAAVRVGRVRAFGVGPQDAGHQPEAAVMSVDEVVPEWGRTALKDPYFKINTFLEFEKENCVKKKVSKFLVMANFFKKPFAAGNQKPLEALKTPGTASGQEGS